MNDELEEIRTRHNNVKPPEGFYVSLRDGQQAHADRATLLRLLSEERARRVEWQPIETAPRDGRYILAIVAEMDDYHMGRQAGRMFCIRYENFGDRYGGWAVYPGYGGAPSSFFTHWQPLPTPPATHKDTQDE
ncbi:hypothetical protein UFOVP399_15 [uncultured Caudovirales phage]|uniref:DUF551 domain-containing protein n=1 Tax=uncultured Caudovirales phage TaxID=2100421 RepID=A0A6J5M2G3_9CAUD|nr:hypothetical protein UFOVP399_15 [uncultured Caudovirales phage]